MSEPKSVLIVDDDLPFADFVRANELKPDWLLAAGRVEHYRKQGYELSH